MAKSILTVVPFCCLVFISCRWKVPESNEGLRADTIAVSGSLIVTDSLAAKAPLADSQVTDQVKNNDTATPPPAVLPDTKNVKPSDIVAFSKTLIGTPYVYGSIDPKVGFDCSGFITYVFSHFSIKVPRSSVDFTNVGKTIDVNAAMPGDLILFTGTNIYERQVGHMGIVVSNDKDGLQFIHSTSGKQMCVTITPLSDYYKTRFVKVIRVF
jgi:cell wall-associated NlpC family hydrolase